MLQDLKGRRRKRNQQIRLTSSSWEGRRKSGDLEPSEGSISKKIE